MTQDIDKCYPEGFEERVKNRGKMVGWAPQQKVLSHPSVACFLSHCGWNSTMEGVCNGVPFLCWPYFADQFLNQGYIAEYWRVGLSLDKDESGIVRRGEIAKKVELLLSDESYKTRVLNLRSKTMSSATEGGSSHKNLSSFVDWIKETAEKWQQRRVDPAPALSEHPETDSSFTSLSSIAIFLSHCGWNSMAESISN